MEVDNMIKRELSIFLFLIIFLLTIFQFSPAIGSSVPVVLLDDTQFSDLHIPAEHPPIHNYTFTAHPGRYTVVAVLHGEESDDPTAYRSFISEFSDENYSSSVFYAEFNARQEFDPKNVKFHVIDGTDLENGTSYYVQCGWIDSPGSTWRYKLQARYYIEIENGNNTGMRTLEVNSSVTSDIGNEIFDAYQVYLEAGHAYNVTLTGGSTFSFDLYLTNGTTLASSCIAAWGANETIVSFIPEETGYFCIVVTNPMKFSGEYELEIKRTKPIELPPSTGKTSSEPSITTPTTPTTSASSFPGFFTILGCFATLVVFIRRHKN
jgi:hypothetical protein